MRQELVCGQVRWLAPVEANGFVRLPGMSGALRAVAFDSSGRQVLAAGDGGTLLRSGDGGASWQLAAPLPIANDNTSLNLLRLQSGRLLLAANAIRGRDRSVLQLFLSPDSERLRVCGGEYCGWVYVDHSRNGLRRWCEMETCGTRAKNRRRGRRPRRARNAG